MPDPLSGLFPWNVELLVAVDDVLGVEVVGMAQGPACNQTGHASDWRSAERLAQDAGFPQHWLVVRPNGDNDPRAIKGVNSRLRCVPHSTRPRPNPTRAWCGWRAICVQWPTPAARG